MNGIGINSILSVSTLMPRLNVFHDTARCCKKALPICLLALIATFSCMPTAAKPIDLQISADRRSLSDHEGKPFYWLADTAWDLLYATTNASLQTYIASRKSLGFNIVLVQLVGGSPSAPDKQGNTSVVAPHSDEWSLNSHFVMAAQEKIQRLNDAGLTVALVVIWGNNINEGKLTPAAAKHFGEQVGSAFGTQKIIWLLGGDTNPTGATIAVWRALAEGLDAGSPVRHLMAYHPSSGSASQWFSADPWLDIYSQQSGHARFRPRIKSISGLIRADFDAPHVRPVVDLESGYEGIPQGLYGMHPKGSRVPPSELIDAYDIRVRAYQQYVSGAFGYTYGQINVMQFWSPGKRQNWSKINRAWQTSLNTPGVAQLRIYQDVRRRIGSPYLVPDDKLVLGTRVLPDYAKTLAGCAPDKLRCLVYSASGVAFEIASDRFIQGQNYRWVDPRTGRSFAASPQSIQSNRLLFTPPAEPNIAFVPKGLTRSQNDWLLVIEPSDQSNHTLAN